MKDDCLHCALTKAAEKWFKTHNAPSQDIINMLGNFAVQAIAAQPDFQGLAVQVIILGTKFTNETERLH